MIFDADAKAQEMHLLTALTNGCENNVKQSRWVATILKRKRFIEYFFLAAEAPSDEGFSVYANLLRRLIACK